MPWPTSGMRSTSQLTMTMAVITGRLNYRYAGGRGRPSAAHREVTVERRDVAGPTVVEQHPHPAGPADGTGPRAVQLDDPHPGGLQPAQDDLGLLGRG